MSLQNPKPEKEKELDNSELSHQEGQDKDQLSDDTFDEVNGGLIWQPSPASGNGQYSSPISWTPES